ncbi:MAG: hypothetical protein M1587_10290 [Thaumarchaeota archaeon]|nr:hypothetical protein [Nitrososphaerota archaeon]MDG6908181.1 hypothetical protein [Nitrososphaerota archaeon]
MSESRLLLLDECRSFANAKTRPETGIITPAANEANIAMLFQDGGLSQVKK